MATTTKGQAAGLAREQAQEQARVGLGHMVLVLGHMVLGQVGAWQ